MHVVLEVDGEPHELWLVRSEDRVRVEVGGATLEAVAKGQGRAFEVRLDGEVHRVEVLGPERARLDGREVRFLVPFFAPGGAPGQHEAGQGGAKRVLPPMPGRIVALKVREGEAVRKGQVLLVLESMKMQNEVLAPRDGTVVKLHVKAGQAVEAGQPLVDLEG